MVLHTVSYEVPIKEDEQRIKLDIRLQCPQLFEELNKKGTSG